MRADDVPAGSKAALFVALVAASFAATPAESRKPTTKAPVPILQKTVNTGALVFEGLYAGAKTINTSPLSFEGLGGQPKTIAVSALSFEGLYVGMKTINVSALSFEGTAAAPKFVTPAKGARK